jgi:FtsP/CotA-like multicopper oxidase with cupredoxin domain
MQPRFQVRTGARYRLRMRNASNEIFPVHLQGQPLELVAVDGRLTAGVIKDVVMLAAHQQLAVEFTPESPGRHWLYCHRQLHRDFGFMAVIDYI